MGTSASKISALQLFHRVFGCVRHFTFILWFLGAMILANNITSAFLSIFPCNPVSKAWSQETPGTCVDALLAACIPGAINAALDITVVLLPISMIIKIQIPQVKKIQLALIFLLSGLYVSYHSAVVSDEVSLYANMKT